MNRDLTYEQAHEWFRLDEETGQLYWKKSPNRAVKVGDRAGSLREGGYRQIKVAGKKYREHRVVFLLANGYWPENQIDHLDGVRDNNRPCNLKEVSPMCNMQNQKIKSTNTSSFPGVCWHKQNKKFKAQIQIQGKYCSLGYYDSALEAALARYTAEVWHPGWTCNHRSELVKAIQKVWPEFRPTK